MLSPAFLAYGFHTSHTPLTTFTFYHDSVQVIAACYDNPIPGYGTNTVGNLRLWESRPVTEFKLDEFNEGHYVEVKATSSELLSITDYHSPFQVHLTSVAKPSCQSIWHVS